MSSLGSGTAKVMIGRVATMAIAFLTVPLITRTFEPKDYGIVGTIETYSQWLAAFACLGYVHAIPLAKDRGELRSILKLCALLTVVLLAPMLAALIFFDKDIAALLDQQTLWMLLWFIPVLFLMSSISQIATYTFAKERKYAWLNGVEIGTAGIGRIFQIGLGVLIGGTAFMFLLGTALGLFVTLLVAVLMMVKMLRHRGENEEAVPLTAVIRQHAQFPKVHLWSQVFNFSSLTLSIWLMGAMYGFAVVGYYNLSRKLLLLPLMILGTSLARVFYPEASDEYNKTGAVSTSFTATVKILFTTCLFPIAAMALFGPLVFSIAAGKEYGESGIYTQMLAPYMLLILLTSPVSTVFLIKRRANILFYYNLLLILCRPASLAIGKGLAIFTSPLIDYLPGSGFWLETARQLASVTGSIHGPRFGILLFSLSGFLIYLHMLFTAMKLGRVSRKKSGVLFFEETGRALLTLAPAVILQVLDAPVAVIVAALCIGGFIHYLWLINREPTMKQKAMAILNTAAQVTTIALQAGRRLIAREP